MLLEWATQVIDITGTTKYSKNEIARYLKASKASMEETINRILDGDDIEIVDRSNSSGSVDREDNVNRNVERSRPKYSNLNYDQTKKRPSIVVIESTSSSKRDHDDESDCEIVEISAASSSAIQKKQKLKSEDDCVQIISTTKMATIYKKSKTSHSSAIQLGDASHQLLIADDDEDDLSFLNRPSNSAATSSVNLFPTIPFLSAPRGSISETGGGKSKRKEKSLSKSSTSSTKKTTQNATAKSAAAAEKKRLQQEGKERKAAEAEQALAEKTMLSQIKAVNTLKQKVTCAEELIVNMCSTWTKLQETTPTSSAKAIIDSLTGAGAVIVSKPLKIPYTMSFVRKVDRTYDFEEAVWRPCSRKLEMEPYALFLLSASRVAELILEESNGNGVAGNTDSGLLNFFKKCTEVYPNCTIIWILENLQDYYKKIHQARSRKENDELRGLLGQNVTKRRKAGNGEDIVDWDKLPDKRVVEEHLLQVQMAAGSIIKIHPCSSTETAAWIVSFTQQIAFYPEQYVRSSSSLGLSFENNIKSGKGSKETWRRMMMQIPGVSENISMAIVEKYPSCAAFLALISSKSIADAANLLIGIPVHLNGKTRNIGKIVATRVVEVLQGKGNNVVME